MKSLTSGLRSRYQSGTHGFAIAGAIIVTIILPTVVALGSIGLLLLLLQVLELVLVL